VTREQWENSYTCG